MLRFQLSGEVQEKNEIVVEMQKNCMELIGFFCLFVYLLFFFFFTVECGNRSKMTPNSGVEDCGGDRGSDDPK